MKSLIFLSFLLLACQPLQKEKKILQEKKETIKIKIPPLYTEIFPALASVLTKKINDPISEEAINTKIFIIKDRSEKILGYIREVATTTGCNSSCLPVIFTLFFSYDFSFLKLYSKPGLTKKGHRKFSASDYFKLDTIIIKNPEIYQNLSHPLEMVDALTGATKKEFKKDVVSFAAFTSLRVNTYFQQTQKWLKNHYD